MVCITIPAQAAPSQNMTVSGVRIEQDNGTTVIIGFDVNIAGRVLIKSDGNLVAGGNVAAGHNTTTLTFTGDNSRAIAHTVCIDPA